MHEMKGLDGSNPPLSANESSISGIIRSDEQSLRVRGFAATEGYLRVDHQSVRPQFGSIPICASNSVSFAGTVTAPPPSAATISVCQTLVLLDARFRRRRGGSLRGGGTGRVRSLLSAYSEGAAPEAYWRNIRVRNIGTRNGLLKSTTRAGRNGGLASARGSSPTVA